MPTCCGDTALNKAWFLLSISVTLEEKEKKYLNYLLDIIQYML